MHFGKRRTRILAGVGMTAILLTSGTVFAASRIFAGPQGNGTGITSYDWKLTPAGKQLTLGDFPMGAAVSPNHKYMVVSNDGDGTQSLQVVDIATRKVVQTIPYYSPKALYLGVAFSPDGKKLYASSGGNNEIRVYSFRNGKMTEQSPIKLSIASRYPAGLSVSPDGKTLYVANNLSDSVASINLITGKVDKTAKVGHNPYTAFLSKDGNTLYVSNWGESSVTVLNAANMSVEKTIHVGLHPNAIAENPVTGMIYVSNSDSDTITVINPRNETVVHKVSLKPYRGALPGSTPDALTVSPDGRTLYVANADNNDIAVIGLKGEDMGVRGLIPTAWYPTGVFTSSNGKGLMVLNAKGLGAGPNTQGQYIGSMIKGTMSFIPVPDNGQLHRYTEKVKRNNHFNTGFIHEAEDKVGNFVRSVERRTTPIPRFVGEKSPIKHVIYIIKENRTYDQVFGDIKKGNGDPALTQFGANITPNIHKLANQFVLLDNTYTDAEISAQGHNWSTAAISNDYTEKNWMADYSGRGRGYDFEGTNKATYPKDGFLWNDAARAHVNYKDYGEFMSMKKSGTWAPNDPTIKNYDPNYPGWNLNISDLTRYNEWNKQFQQYVKNGKLPQLEIVRLPNDHTKGTTPGALTPQAYVAQNDKALGKIVDTVSHSKYWKSTAIFVIEDDSQNGLDHVDAHRTEALVISPYTQTGKVDSTFYDTASMLKTMEMILGMKPMTQFDAEATPMLGAFTNRPKFTPFNAVPETYPITKTNSANAPMASIAKKMNWSVADINSSDAMNKMLWKATKGNVPYPHVHHTDGSPDVVQTTPGKVG
ncbi:bifunctional YncE family protein/alkaline phosphatase family protein [Alicyclobacillus sp. SO9]|uniref:bifunctional YncE family protein/alkaline phosphatase family protein n=1 Tax=Alicyclobacillus sp. SO9 TaxID=2665646 RepID=UPI0018E8608B|nr:bifunctional YncE family protein/alkaline phosphatase family protein [Alicyclobacillus sp. SO9]QQE78214.1 bifunctional YncE family protein/alkaline phosphatase family protein [Alicyclobacillus sp. SO9]